MVQYTINTGLGLVVLDVLGLGFMGFRVYGLGSRMSG